MTQTIEPMGCQDVTLADAVRMLSTYRREVKRSACPSFPRACLCVEPCHVTCSGGLPCDDCAGELVSGSVR